MNNYEIEPQEHVEEHSRESENQIQNDMLFFMQLKSIQNLVTIATITGPASLLFGGILLGTVAIICGALAIHKLKKLPIANQNHAELVGKVKRSALIAIAISFAAILINGIFVMYMMPEVMAALEAGDLSAIQGGNLASETGSNPSSVWG